MPSAGGHTYYVITVKGERGPVDRAELRRLLAAAEIGNEDQVRSAFGRNLGSVAQVLAVPSDRQGTTIVRDPPSSDSDPPPARPAIPVVGIIIALLLAVAAAVWLATAPTAVPAPVPAPEPVKVPPPPEVQPPAPVRESLANHLPIAIAPGQATAHGPPERKFTGFQVAKATDGDPTTKWFDPVDARNAKDAAGRLSWISYATGERRVAAYALASADDPPARDPAVWRLVGVRADGSEQVLDERQGEAFSGRFQRRIFPIAAPGVFSAYRLDILASKKPKVDGVQLGEFALYGAMPPALGAEGLPGGWTTASIGDDGSPPPAFDAGRWLVRGAGHDIWGTADQFRLVHTTVPEWATLTVSLVSTDGRAAWTKAGIMFRVSTAPGAAFVALVATPKGGVHFQHRPQESAPAQGGPPDSTALPAFLRLVRRGQAVTAQLSGNGRQWREAGTVTLPALAGPLLAGLAVCSNQPGQPMTAVFDSLEITTP